MYDIIIVGSGPAGIASAECLLEKGLRVTIVDIGANPENDITDIKNKFNSQETSQWQISDSEKIFTIKSLASRKSNFDKPVLGSNYYLNDNFAIDKSENIAYPKYSISTGGFSVAWGAATAPYLQSETSLWPVPTEELSHAYRIAAKKMGVIGCNDSLNEILGAEFEQSRLPTQPQIANVLKSGIENYEINKMNGVTIGASRLALNQIKCKKCNKCLNGCVYSAIYSSADVLPLLISKGLNYIAKVKIESFKEDKFGVKLQAKDLASGNLITLECKKLLLGAGVVATSKIILNSLNRSSKLTIKDSQYFLFPCILNNPPSSGFVENHKGTTLSGAFIELKSESIAPNNIHIQLYHHSDLMEGALSKASLGISRLPFIHSRLSQRFMIAQAYLHSDQSSTIDLSLDEESGNINFKYIINPETERVINASIRHLSRLQKSLGFRATTFGKKITEPGRGFHCGGSLPMKLNPKEMETHINGLLYGHKFVYIIDSSTFPSICATTIGMTIYANSYRIASKIND
jgi:choline dehydrogenase-like flavoprotein